MYKQKRANFKTSIRREQLNAYFAKKRKQLHDSNSLFTMDSQNQEREVLEAFEQLTKEQQSGGSFSQLNPRCSETCITLSTLNVLARLSTTKFGVETILRSNYPHTLIQQLHRFSSSDCKFELIKQLDETSFILVNLSYIKWSECPDFTTLKVVHEIITDELSGEVELPADYFEGRQVSEKFISSFRAHKEQAIENCLNLVYNFMFDFGEAMHFYLRKQNYLRTLLQIMDGKVNILWIPIVFKTLLMVLTYNPEEYRKQHRKFLKYFIVIIRDTNEMELIMSSLKNVQLMFVNYQRESEEEFSKIKAQFMGSRVLEKLTKIAQNQLILLSKNNVSQDLLANYEQIQCPLLSVVSFVVEFLTNEGQCKQLFEYIDRCFNAVLTLTVVSRREEALYQIWHIAFSYLKIQTEGKETLLSSSLFQSLRRQFMEGPTSDDLTSTHTQDQKPADYLLKCKIHFFGMLTFDKNFSDLQLLSNLKNAIEYFKNSCSCENEFENFIDCVEMNLSETLSANFSEEI